jgi:hypothetical protein
MSVSSGVTPWLTEEEVKILPNKYINGRTVSYGSDIKCRYHAAANDQLFSFRHYRRALGPEDRAGPVTEFWDAGLVLVALLGSSALGLFVRPLLSERHKSREVIEFVQLVVAMVMTFAALVLGLLTSSVKSSFDKVGNDLRTVAVELIQLDRSLREWGTETRPARELLRSYTAAAIATTWTGEPKPPGDGAVAICVGN